METPISAAVTAVRLASPEHTRGRARITRRSLPGPRSAPAPLAAPIAAPLTAADCIPESRAGPTEALPWFDRVLVLNPRHMRVAPTDDPALVCRRQLWRAISGDGCLPRAAVAGGRGRILARSLDSGETGQFLRLNFLGIVRPDHPLLLAFASASARCGGGMDRGEGERDKNHSRGRSRSPSSAGPNSSSSSSSHAHAHARSVCAQSSTTDADADITNADIGPAADLDFLEGADACWIDDLVNLDPDPDPADPSLGTGADADPKSHGAAAPASSSSSSVSNGDDAHCRSPAACDACDASLQGWWCRGCDTARRTAALRERLGLTPEDAARICRAQLAACSLPKVPCFLCNRDGSRPPSDPTAVCIPAFWKAYPSLDARSAGDNPAHLPPPPHAPPSSSAPSPARRTDARLIRPRPASLAAPSPSSSLSPSPSPAAPSSSPSERHRPGAALALLLPAQKRRRGCRGGRRHRRARNRSVRHHSPDRPRPSSPGGEGAHGATTDLLCVADVPHPAESAQPTSPPSPQHAAADPLLICWGAVDSPPSSPPSSPL